MYNYKGLTVNWETKAFNRSFEGKDLPFNGLNFRVIDNYGSVLDEFSGAYGIDIKPDNESINSFIRRHIDQNEEKYIKILQENGFDSEGLVKTIYELEESEKYRFGYHFLAPLDKDGYLLYDTAKEFTQIVPEEYYQTADNEKLFKWLSNFDRIKYAEAVEFGNVKYEKDVVTELSVDYGSDAYKLYESDLYSDTIDKMLMSEMSLEDLLQIHHNFNLFINRGSKFEQQGRIHNLAESKEIDAEIKQMLDENMVYYGNYYHKTVPVIIDNIIKTLNRIQAYEEQDEDDEEMEF